MGQTTGSAPTSQPTQVATDCATQLATALTRLDKTLDAYEKTTAALTASQFENSQRKMLDDLRLQQIAVKDAIIAAQADLIKFYEKGRNGISSRFKKLLEIAEKVALIASGILLGRGL